MRLVAIPDDEFEAKLQTYKPPTLSDLPKIGTKKKPVPKPKDEEPASEDDDGFVDPWSDMTGRSWPTSAPGSSWRPSAAAVLRGQEPAQPALRGRPGPGQADLPLLASPNWTTRCGGQRRGSKATPSATSGSSSARSSRRSGARTYLRAEGPSRPWERRLARPGHLLLAGPGAAPHATGCPRRGIGRLVQGSAQMLAEVALSVPRAFTVRAERISSFHPGTPACDLNGGTTICTDRIAPAEPAEARVDAFVARHFSLRGTLALHRGALGLDLLRAPLNVVLAPVFVLTRLAAFLARLVRLRRVAAWLGSRRILLPTRVASRVEALVRDELLTPGAVADPCRRPPCNRLRGHPLSCGRDHHQVRRLLKELSLVLVVSAVGSGLILAMAIGMS